MLPAQQKTCGGCYHHLCNRITCSLREGELALGEVGGGVREAAGPQDVVKGSLGLLCIHDAYLPNPAEVCDK